MGLPRSLCAPRVPGGSGSESAERGRHGRRPGKSDATRRACRKARRPVPRAGSDGRGAGPRTDGPGSTGRGPGANPDTTALSGQDAGREFRGARRPCGPAGGEARADDRPPSLVQPRPGRGADRGPDGAGDRRHDHRVGLRQARPGRLAAAAVLVALQRGLERGLGAIAQGFGGRAAARLDQCRGGEPEPELVLHVRPGVQRPPEGQRLPRFLHAHDAAEPSPDADHEHPVRAPQQRRQRPAHRRRPETSSRRRRRRATRGSATSRSRPASCCTRRRTSRSRASSR